MKRKVVLAWLTALVALSWGSNRAEETPAAKAVGEAQPVAPQPKFIRLRRDESDQPLAMETAVVRYLPAEAGREGIAVDLIGAVHVGDKAYYDELNKLFESYDAVLYELVAPEGTRVPKEGRKGPSAHPIGALQDGMSTILDLKHQLDSVDYTKANFVHADMSPDDFAKAMEKRGESFTQLFLRLMGQGMAQSASKGEAAGSSDLALLMALFSKDRPLKLKILMAEQFNDLGGQLAVLDGPDGSAILTERNKRCFEVLGKQLKEGKKKIGVFYGAAHLPDMERRLLADYGLKRDKEDWLVAWSLQKAAKK